MASTDVTVTIRGSVPRLPFAEMADAVLGSTYQLSVVICGDHLSRRLNQEHRQKSYFPNVLSFPIDTNEGEIFLNLRKAAREARQMNTTLSKRAALLYVHGLFHLKGLDHSDRMEAEEARVLRRFKLL